ncbi:MAG: hypothetical protein JHC76_08160 [Akkermansiaceae bacterium]|nr:hypothetical protein [Akkermansiaceae bacterium]
MNFRPYGQLLFQHTPPTALIIRKSLLFTAAQQHLARRGIAAPENISLICPPSISSVTKKATKSTPSSKPDRIHSTPWKSNPARPSRPTSFPASATVLPWNDLSPLIEKIA